MTINSGASRRGRLWDGLWKDGSSWMTSRDLEPTLNWSRVSEVNGKQRLHVWTGPPPPTRYRPRRAFTAARAVIGCQVIGTQWIYNGVYYVPSQRGNLQRESVSRLYYKIYISSHVVKALLCLAVFTNYWALSYSNRLECARHN